MADSTHHPPGSGDSGNPPISTSLRGAVVRPSTHTPGEQLETLRRALIQKNGEAALLAIASAIVTSSKILAEPLKDGWAKFGIWDLSVIIAVTIPTYVATVKYFKKDSQNEQAQEIVSGQMVIQEEQDTVAKDIRLRRERKAREADLRRSDWLRFAVFAAPFLGAMSVVYLKPQVTVGALVVVGFWSLLVWKGGHMLLPRREQTDDA
jgi:hypothetical protein